MNSLTSFGSNMSDMSMSSFGYSPPMQGHPQLPSLGYANPRDLNPTATSRRPRRGHRRMLSDSRLAHEDDEEEMLCDGEDNRVAAAGAAEQAEDGQEGDSGR